MSGIWFFEDTNLFKVLCPHKFKKYKQAHGFEGYKKSEYIYFEEDASNKVFLIDKGKVKIGSYTDDGEEVIKAILTRGEIFGEKCILGEERRNEFAQSLDNKTSICPVPLETMHDLMKDNQTFSMKVYKFIGFRIRKLERRLEMLLFKDAKTRVVELINDLAEQYGRKLLNGQTVIEHPYTQKDMANLIGTSRPTLNSIINELKGEGYLRMDGKKIFIDKDLVVDKEM